MRSADVILVFSRSEAFGRVTIEAMIAGKPVIGARSGATAELIQNGVNGLLYSVGDPESLAAEIRYLHDNPKVADQLGKNARKWVEEHFSQDRYSEKILSVLASISNSHAILA